MHHFLSQLGVGAGGDRSALARRSLEAVRRHLNMDVAYVSEFVGDTAVFREVDAPGLEHLIAVGDTKSLEDVYCRHILAGRLPELMPDTAAFPLAVSMPITSAVPIGAHVSVPIRRPGGELYGMFCCLSATPQASLHERDLHIVRAFAGLVAEEIEHEAALREAREVKRGQVLGAMQADAFHICLQPIFTVACRQIVGFEALSRFACQPQRSPDKWFADAAEVGLGSELECAAIARALEVLPHLPAPLTLSVNASPETVISGALDTLLAGAVLDRVVLEVTEHAEVTDYAELCGRLAPLRARGMKLAIDDAGAGFSGLQHILRLQPDIIKLDMTLIRGIDADPARRALASAMQMFARQTGAVLVAEGVETRQELHALVALSVARVQGYLLGRPMPADDAIALVAPGRAATG